MSEITSAKIDDVALKLEGISDLLASMDNSAAAMILMSALDDCIKELKKVVGNE